jgi:hypothetical protein
MLISELLYRFDFHDSIVEEIKFLPDENMFIMNLEFCNWKQSFYKETDGKILHVPLIFNSVKKYQIIPDLTIKDNEILRMELIETDDQVLGIKIVLNEESDVIIIKIETTDATFDVRKRLGT